MAAADRRRRRQYTLLASYRDSAHIEFIVNHGTNWPYFRKTPINQSIMLSPSISLKSTLNHLIEAASMVVFWLNYSTTITNSSGLRTSASTSNSALFLTFVLTTARAFFHTSPSLLEPTVSPFPTLKQGNFFHLDCWYLQENFDKEIMSEENAQFSLCQAEKTGAKSTALENQSDIKVGKYV